MANRYLRQFTYSFNAGLTFIEGSAVIDSGQASGVRSLKGSGIAAITRLGIGTYRVTLQDTYARYLGGDVRFVSPFDGVTTVMGSLVPGKAYCIISGGSTVAQWVAAGLAPGVVPALGVAFVAQTVGAGSGTVQGFADSGIAKAEVIGDPNLTINNLNGVITSSSKTPSFLFQTKALNPSATSGSAVFAPASSYAVLGATAVTNTGSSVLTGNLGVYPGTSITGFPPGTFTGTEDIANAKANNAKAAAQATYTAMHSAGSTAIAAELGSQSLVAGVYSTASGAFTLNGTLTLTGSATDVFVFQTASTLITGGTATPVITLAGGAVASNVFWVVGSSATLASSHAGVMVGNVIALTSITDTLGTAVNGSLVALNGAVTLSAATAVSAQPFSVPNAYVPADPADGSVMGLTIWVRNSSVKGQGE